MISFRQVNLHKAEQATILLGQSMEGKTRQVSLISEPYTVMNKITGLPRNMKLIYDRSCPRGTPPRAGICLSKDVTLTSLDSLCNRDCAAGLIKLNGRNTLVASVYLDITQPTIPTWLDDLIDLTTSKRWPVILGIDTNAHSTLYGPDTNGRGEEVEAFVLRHQLKIENTGMLPTFETHRGRLHIQTHIDATFTRDLPGPILNWTVDQTYNGSDHNTIKFDIGTPAEEKTQVRPWSRANWTAFSSCLLYTSPSPRDRQKSRMPSSA